MLTADATVVLYLEKFTLLVVTIDICHITLLIFGVGPSPKTQHGHGPQKPSLDFLLRLKMRPCPWSIPNVPLTQSYTDKEWPQE